MAAFAAILFSNRKSTEEIIEKNKDENKNLAQLRDTLLPKLMSGELKLSEIKTKLYE